MRCSELLFLLSRLLPPCRISREFSRPVETRPGRRLRRRLSRFVLRTVAHQRFVQGFRIYGSHFHLVADTDAHRSGNTPPTLEQHAVQLFLFGVDDIVASGQEFGKSLKHEGPRKRHGLAGRARYHACLSFLISTRRRRDGTEVPPATAWLSATHAQTTIEALLSQQSLARRRIGVAETRTPASGFGRLYDGVFVFAGLWRDLRRRVRRRRNGRIDAIGRRRGFGLSVQIGHLEDAPFKAWANICRWNSCNDEICDYISRE